MANAREQLSSRLGFILLCAGCAIGLGNIWRFPFIVGQHGGAAFILLYAACLVLLGLPILIVELAIGRAGRRNLAGAMGELQHPGQKWHIAGHVVFMGNFLLMAFYTGVAGWILAYGIKTVRGEFIGLSTEQVAGAFGAFISSPGPAMGYMAIVCVIGVGVCAIGVRSGVERMTKVIMACLLLAMGVLAVRSFTLPNSGQGLRFFLQPNMDSIATQGLWKTTYTAMGQAFFTLSLGIGSMTIFGSYLKKTNRILSESLWIIGFDFTVAMLAGLIIFPACFSYGVNVSAGPGLIFVTLPNVFNHISHGHLWGGLFFLFLFLAAISTVIAVVENLIAYFMDTFGWRRRTASGVGLVVLVAISTPSTLGFGLLADVHPFGFETILDFLDFLVSDNLLPLGGLLMVCFCSHRYGWGWKKFCLEANTGKGMKFPTWLRWYVAYIIPAIILTLYIGRYLERT